MLGSSMLNHSFDCSTATSFDDPKCSCIGVSSLRSKVFSKSVYAPRYKNWVVTTITGLPFRLMVPLTSTIFPESRLITALICAVVLTTSPCFNGSAPGTIRKPLDRCTSLRRSPSIDRGNMGFVIAFQPTTMAKSMGARTSLPGRSTYASLVLPTA